MKRRLADIEAQREHEVAAFLEAHPEFADDDDMRDRPMLQGERLTVYPVDPTLLADFSDVDDGDGEAEHGDGLVFRNLFPPADHPLTSEQLALRDVFDAAFERMTEEDVDLLRRRYLERMTLDAIADEEGVTRQAIIKRLGRARARLRDSLGDDWGAPE